MLSFCAHFISVEHRKAHSNAFFMCNRPISQNCAAAISLGAAFLIEHAFGYNAVTADGLPYIGPYGRRTPNLFVAAAYGGQGILGSITAAQVISARILGLRCEGDFIFSGQRRASASRMNELKTCLSIGAHYASGSFRTRAPRCPHMGCRMKFNPSTRLWECPCHGSRFDGIGHWRNGPAVHDAIIRRK